MTDTGGGIRSNDFCNQRDLPLSADGPDTIIMVTTVKPLNDGLSDSDKTARLDVSLSGNVVASLNLRTINVTDKTKWILLLSD